MNERLRKPGIEMIEDILWGTYFCQLYQTQEDLMDILVPYLKVGLENNELCIWALPEPFEVKEEAIKILRKAISDFNVYLEKGQIEIIPYSNRYLKEGIPDSQGVLKTWIKKVDQALNCGYNGLRLTDDFSWIKKDHNDFIDYEEKLDSVIGNPKIKALCTYSLNSAV